MVEGLDPWYRLPCDTLEVAVQTRTGIHCFRQLFIPFSPRSHRGFALVIEIILDICEFLNDSLDMLPERGTAKYLKMSVVLLRWP